MLVRIVKMSFYKQNVEVFLKHFDANKKRIRGYNGCTFLELYRDKKDPSIFFTYSHWETEKDLERYRKSEVFNDVWSVVKPLFSIRPEAWSLEKLESLE